MCINWMELVLGVFGGLAIGLGLGILWAMKKDVE